MTPKKWEPLLAGKDAEDSAEMLRAIAHPLRLAIIDRLLDGERNVSQLCEDFGQPQAAVSQQLKILRLNQLVEVRKSGNFSFYGLKEDHRDNLGRMLSCLKGCVTSESRRR